MILNNLDERLLRSLKKLDEMRNNFTPFVREINKAEHQRDHQFIAQL